jgi:hypothetical protein
MNARITESAARMAAFGTVNNSGMSGHLSQRMFGYELRSREGR